MAAAEWSSSVSASCLWRAQAFGTGPTSGRCCCEAAQLARPPLTRTVPAPSECGQTCIVGHSAHGQRLHILQVSSISRKIQVWVMRWAECRWPEGWALGRQLTWQHLGLGLVGWVPQRCHRLGLPRSSVPPTSAAQVLVWQLYACVHGLLLLSEHPDRGYACTAGCAGDSTPIIAAATQRQS